MVLFARKVEIHVKQFQIIYIECQKIIKYLLYFFVNNFLINNERRIKSDVLGQ